MPVRVLDREECSVGVVEYAREPDRFLARPLTSDPVVVSEPVNVLWSALCADRLDGRLSELVIVLESPLVSELANTSEPARNLNSELCSIVVPAGPNEPVKDLVRPLV